MMYKDGPRAERVKYKVTNCENNSPSPLTVTQGSEADFQHQEFSINNICQQNKTKQLLIKFTLNRFSYLPKTKNIYKARLFLLYILPTLI